MGICQSTNAASDAATKSALPPEASVIFVLGGPGSGKGTQCEKITAAYDCAHISVGDLIRAEVESESELGKSCAALMKEGKLVPLETTLGLLQQRMLRSEKKTFLIDGFPRAIEQATRFDAEIQPCTAVLYFDCSENVMTQRLLERGKTSGREDDHEETIRKRLQTFKEVSEPVAKFYEEQGKCYRIPAENAPDAVFEEVQATLNRYLKKIGGATAAQTAPAAEAPKEASPPSGASAQPTAAATAPEIEPDVVEAPPEKEAKAVSRVVFVLGGPGSGKGTQCERIVADYGFRHISIGDLLRAEVESGSELGTECDALMREGKLVPSELTLDILKKAIKEGSADCYLIDGFPRSIEQAELFERNVASCDGVLFFECSEKTMLERMKKRSEKSGRIDDNPETMQKRLATFAEVSFPVVRFYTDLGKCHTVSAERDPSEIYTDVQLILNALKEKPASGIKTPAAVEESASDLKTTAGVEESASDPPQTGAVEESEPKIVLILGEEDCNTGNLLSSAIPQKGLVCERGKLSHEMDLAALGAKAVLWNFAPAAEALGEEVQEKLRQVAQKGVVLIPSLEFVAACQEASFSKQVHDKECPEDAKTATVLFCFDMPVEVTFCGQGEATPIKADEPEVAPFVEQLIREDLSKIKAATGEVLPPIWSADYKIIEEEENGTAYVFHSLNCPPLDLTDKMQYVAPIVDGIAAALAKEN